MRQKILGFEIAEESDGTQWCMIMVDPVLVQTIAVPKRAIQGWRYLEQKDAPKDRGVYVAGVQDEEPPEDMAQDLKALGLL